MFKKTKSPLKACIYTENKPTSGDIIYLGKHGSQKRSPFGWILSVSKIQDVFRTSASERTKGGLPSRACVAELG